MADVETAQKASVQPLEGADRPPSPVAVCEENLAALLRAVTAADPAPALAPVLEVLPPPVAEPPVAPQAAPIGTVTLEPERVERAASEENRQPESRGEPHAESHNDAEPLSGAPASPAREVSPAVETQPAVFSKLALISSIKRRRAVALRPETGNPAAAEPQTERLPIPQPETAAVQNTAERERRQQPALDEQSARAIHSDPAKQVEPARQELREAEKSAPPVKEVPRSSSDTPRPKESPMALAAKRAALYSARPAASPLFASMSAPPKDTAFGKLERFATSGAGMGVFGGVILAGGLTVFFLMGHGTKPATSSLKPVVKESARAESVSSPAPASSPAERVSTEKPSGGSAPTGNSRTENLKKDDLEKDDKSAARPETGQAAKSAASETPAEADATRTAARAFSPPAAAGTRLAINPILEAPPTVTTTQSAPAAFSSGIAALPPPAAPSIALPRQISVADKAQAAKLIRRVTPTYPSLARTARIQGIVRFRATIGTDGQIKGLVTLGGPPPLVQSAADAVKQWRYQPTVLNGEAVEVVTEIDVSFSL